MNDVPCLVKLSIMNSKQVDYYSKLKARLFSDQKQKITYSFNEMERTITGIMQEKEDLIYLYEYRGQYIGIEFFISFSKKSISYKLIKVDEMASWFVKILPPIFILSVQKNKRLFSVLLIVSIQ